ncbi:MAG: NAD-dependent epimerase/dehydratase family protein [Phaeodactylibacter sp.]|nr:NAD-dependent epimerase/dehydratase family protein [Phaeodactylibacter sp.]MCB9265681.1 NAD-dependent epimerase/dehydratase family protein [Lewinellaceae bacterium]MCB9288386.1 NAD-dependent epimerase/dehydratase family protein [Lewinellaceae bacterium]
METETILVTGANGQIGTVLTEELRRRFGTSAVLSTDIRQTGANNILFEELDVLDSARLSALIEKYGVKQIYHLAAILSAKGEKNPKWAWEINMAGLFNILEAARKYGLRVFFPSSIAVFGGMTPRVDTPQHAVLQPETVYGISKVAGENWCQYFHQKYGVDVRSVRYPGIIGYESLPGGGTTDYAVEIFHSAVKGEAYECFLGPDTRLPMMYMPDAIRATLELMEAPSEKIRIRSSYNLAGVSFTPAEVKEEIQKHYPAFEVSYKPDFRQEIASSWPESIDDSYAREHWGWKPQYGLPEMASDMLEHLREYYAASVS